MTVNKQKIKKFKKITKNFVLAGTLAAVLITSPAFITNAKAKEPINSTPSYYELSSDSTYLYIEGDVDLSILEKTPNVNELYISESNVSNTNYLENTNIKSLSFEHCNFTDTNINIPENIEHLYFSNCEFNNLENISNSNSLTSLSFYECTLGSISGIEKLNSIETLSFYSCGIENIEQLKFLDNLQYLTLSYTCVNDLSPIANLDLSFLDVSNSLSIDNLNPVMGMHNLTEFYAQNCEMQYTQDIINYVYENSISSDITQEGLEIKNKILNIKNNIINENMNTEEKIQAIVDYVVNNITYDSNVDYDEELSNEYNRYALKYALEGIGCCRNYTALTTALLQASGIKVYETLGERHIWNVVNVDGEYYWLDTTTVYTDNFDDITLSKSYMTTSDEFTIINTSSCFPSSYYNKIKNNNLPSNVNKEQTSSKDEYIDEYTTLNTTEVLNESETLNARDFENTKEELNKENIFRNLTTQKASIGAIVGVAAALGSAFAIKKKKKLTNIEKEKMGSKTK